MTVKIIAVANQKGGVGKTTTSINLSACLSFLGKKVLLIDLDPQAHSSIGLGINPEELEKSLFDVFDDSQYGDVGLNDVLVKSYRNLDLVPAQVILSAIEQKLSGQAGRESKLSDKIKSLKNAYDYIVIDCPPSLGLLTFNALSAADEVLVPVEPSFFAFHGLKKLLETITLVREVVKHTITVHAVLTIFDVRTKHARDIGRIIQNFFSDNILSVIIRKNIKLQEAARAGKPITEYDKNSIGFKDYMNLAVEMIKRCGKEELPADTSTLTFQELLSASEKTSEEVGKEQVEVNVEPSSDNVAVGVKETVQTLPEVKVKIDCSPRVAVGGILFSFQSQDAETVAVAGDFNNWRPEKLNTPCLNEDVWTKVVPLCTGKYNYKYIVDSMWGVDPDNINRELNSFGVENSVIEVS